MFKRTRLRLVLLNSIVFFVLFNVFVFVIYAYTEHRLYEDVDRIIEAEMKSLLFRGNHEWMERRDRDGTDLVLWDREGNAKAQLPAEAFDATELNKLREYLNQSGNHTVKINGSTYRLATQTFGDGTVQLLYNADAERSVLTNLMIILLICLAISLVIAVFAGFLLAGKALVPIQKAWDKQQQFVSDASHELRTPLAVMRLHLDRFLRHPERTIGQESRKVEVMLDETERMSRLVANLLTLARSDNHELQLLIEEVNLRDCIIRVTESLSELAAAKGLQIGVLAEQDLVLRADRERISQLLLILLDNSVRYTKEGRIDINAERIGQMVRLSITDTGMGISKEDIPHIFDRFYRADKMRNRADGGVGLGLSIAQWVVEAHKGRISVESTPEQGSTFHIWLPIASD